MGKVYIVGAGPGDPELITVKGLRLIEIADVILYDRLIPRALLSYAKPQALLIDVGKRPGPDKLAQSEINSMLHDLALKYDVVVRLHGGDPLIFGRGFEECEYLLTKGIVCEIVPGITSGLAAPAKYYIPPVVRGTASSVALVTGREDPSKGRRQVNFRKLATAVDTIIVYMGAATAKDIAEELIAGGLPPDTPVAIIESAYFEDESFKATTLGALGPVRNPAIIVVGKVVERGLKAREALCRSP